MKLSGQRGVKKLNCTWKIKFSWPPRHRLDILNIELYKTGGEQLRTVKLSYDTCPQ